MQIGRSSVRGGRLIGHYSRSNRSMKVAASGPKPVTELPGMASFDSGYSSNCSRSFSDSAMFFSASSLMRS